MIEALSLRPVEDADRPFLRAVFDSTRAEFATLGLGAEALETLLEGQFTAQDAWWRQQAPTAAFDLILVGDHPVGRLYVDRRSDEIRVVDISLLPTARGQGLGTRLLTELVAESDRSQVPLTIHVEQHNPARRLYERLGFQEAGDAGVYVFMRRPSRGSPEPETDRTPLS